MKTLTISSMAALFATAALSSAAAHTGAPHVHAGAGVVDLAPAALVAMAALWLGLRALRSAAQGEEGDK